MIRFRFSFTIQISLSFLSIYHLSYPVSAETVVKKYEPFDIVLSGNTHENPYLEVDLTATFSGPDSTTFDLEGFWDGDTTWKIRVAPTLVGHWTFVTTSNDSLLDGVIGSFDCVPSNSRGFLKTSGHHFIYDDGTSSFRMGDTCWRMFRSKNAAFDSLFIPYVDARANQGFNYIMGVIHTVGDPSINEGGSLWVNDTNLDSLQPGYFVFVDRRIEYLQSKGITTGLVFVWSQTFRDFTEYQFERFVRYIVARYAAHDVVWILCGEYTEEGQPDDYSNFGHLVERRDPYGHPISIHPGGLQSNSQDIGYFPWLDHIMQQMYGEPEFLNQKILDDRVHGLVVANDEFGYEGPTDQNDPYFFFNNQNQDEVRKDAWAICFGGGYFVYGNMYTYTGKEFIIRLDKLETPGAHYLRILANYFRNAIPSDEMLPNNALTVDSGFCLTMNDSLLLFYFPDSSEVTLDLNLFTTYFTQSWFDPKTENIIENSVIRGGEIQSTITPFSDDAVLRLIPTAPDMAIQHDHTAVTPNDSVAFSSLTVGSADTKQFTIQSLGEDPLYLVGTPMVQVQGASAFQISQQPNSPIQPSMTSEFEVSFTPQDAGNHSATISLPNSDYEKDPYDFSVTGIGWGPEISVYEDTSEIVSGGSISLGIAQLVVSDTTTFTISNSGTDELMLEEPAMVQLSGSSAFTVVLQPTGLIPANSSTTFEILFEAENGEGDSTLVSIPSNDYNENPFTFKIVVLGNILGDVDHNFVVNSTDALILLSCDVGFDVQQFCPMDCGDVNNDGFVNSTDALIILSSDVGISVPFPVGESDCPLSITPCAGCGP